jgi:hypothetical protein
MGPSLSEATRRAILSRWNVRTEVLSKAEFNGFGGLRTHISFTRITIGFPER